MSNAVVERPRPSAQLPDIREPRLPYHPLCEERFGIDKSSWKALVEAIFPNATSTASVVLALAYCKARSLDIFKRCVHIVPIWNKDDRCYYDTIWPGIGELRTTAFRTGEYAGRDETVFGPDITRKIGDLELTFPAWARITVYRIVKGIRCPFIGPKVYWLETYATRRHDDDTPNEMWGTRPSGQLEKCAEAGALRAAFPEELGGDCIPEEVENSRSFHGRVAIPQSKTKIEAITNQLTGQPTQQHELPESSYQPPADNVVESSVAPEEQAFQNFLRALPNLDRVGDVDSLLNSVLQQLTPEHGKQAVELAKEQKDKIKANKKQQKELVS